MAFISIDVEEILARQDLKLELVFEGGDGLDHAYGKGLQVS